MAQSAAQTGALAGFEQADAEQMVEQIAVGILPKVFVLCKVEQRELLRPLAALAEFEKAVVAQWAAQIESLVDVVSVGAEQQVAQPVVGTPSMEAMEIALHMKLAAHTTEQRD